MHDKGTHHQYALRPGLMLVALLSAPAQAEIGDTLSALIDDGKTSLGFRYRLEEVHQDNALEDATASTLRTRLGFQTGTLNGFQALLEADNVLVIGPDQYDSFQPDRYRATHSVIPDPVGTEINQALLRYQVKENVATLGRQRINHAGQRFLGGVGWRQNEQTYDAASLHWSTGSISLDYSYLWNVNRIFGGSAPSAQLTDFDSDSHALLSSLARSWGTVSGFIYALDFDNAPGVSSLTYGISYSGAINRLRIAASYAVQQEHGSNPSHYRTDYRLLEASLPLQSWTLLLGHEVLASDEGLAGFSTPLATLHKFQGFADVFLTTPAAGLKDSYFTLTHSNGPWNLSAGWHNFQADATDEAFGTELDLAVVYRFSSDLSTELKFASYNNRGFAADINKLWITLNLAL